MRSYQLNGRGWAGDDPSQPIGSSADASTGGLSRTGLTVRYTSPRTFIPSRITRHPSPSSSPLTPHPNISATAAWSATPQPNVGRKVDGGSAYSPSEEERSTTATRLYAHTRRRLLLRLRLGLGLRLGLPLWRESRLCSNSDPWASTNSAPGLQPIAPPTNSASRSHLS